MNFCHAETVSNSGTSVNENRTTVIERTARRDHNPSERIFVIADDRFKLWADPDNHAGQAGRCLPVGGR